MRDPGKYLRGHIKSGIEVGDKVEVLRTAENNEGGWWEGWNPNMDNMVGKTYEVLADRREKGFLLVGEHGDYWVLPYFVLEKQESIAVSMKPEEINCNLCRHIRFMSNTCELMHSEPTKKCFEAAGQ